MAWLWGIIIGFLTWYSVMNIMLSTYIIRAVKDFKSDKAEAIIQRYASVIVVWGLIFIVALICFFAIPYLLEQQSWTIPCTIIGIILGIITYSTQKVNVLRDLEDKEHLLEKELEHATKDINTKEKEEIAKALLYEAKSKFDSSNDIEYDDYEDNIDEDNDETLPLTLNNWTEYFFITAYFNNEKKQKIKTLITTWPGYEISNLSAKAVFSIELIVHPNESSKPIKDIQKVSFTLTNFEQEKNILPIYARTMEKYDAEYIEVGNLEFVELKDVSGTIHFVDDEEFEDDDEDNEIVIDEDENDDLNDNPLDRCPYCGFQVFEDEEECSYCHKKLTDSKEKISTPTKIVNEYKEDKQTTIEFVECKECHSMVVSTENECPNCGEKI